VGANGKERPGGGGVRFLYWRGAHGDGTVGSWCSGRVLAGVGGGAAVRRPGVHYERVFGRT
jgi:hypothetical protein